jgi:hypothetical protein
VEIETINYEVEIKKQYKLRLVAKCAQSQHFDLASASPRISADRSLPSPPVPPPKRWWMLESCSWHRLTTLKQIFRLAPISLRHQISMKYFHYFLLFSFCFVQQISVGWLYIVVGAITILLVSFPLFFFHSLFFGLLLN